MQSATSDMPSERSVRIGVAMSTRAEGLVLAQSVHSVLSQQGDFELSVHVRHHGGSREVRALMVSVASQLRLRHWPIACRGVRFAFSLQSPRDDACAADSALKALCAASPVDMLLWLPQAEALLEGAVAAIADVHRRVPAADWVTGRCIDRADTRATRLCSTDRFDVIESAALLTPLGERALAALSASCTAFTPRLWDVTGPFTDRGAPNAPGAFWLRAAKHGFQLLDARLAISAAARAAPPPAAFGVCPAGMV